MQRPTQEAGLGHGSPNARLSKKAQGIGTSDRMTMKVSTLECFTTALPAVMVMKNMPAAGPKETNFFHSSRSTSMVPMTPASHTSSAAGRNWSVVSTQTKGKACSAHLFTTSSNEAEMAWPHTRSVTLLDEGSASGCVGWCRAPPPIDAVLPPGDNGAPTLAGDTERARFPRWWPRFLRPPLSWSPAELSMPSSRASATSSDRLVGPPPGRQLPRPAPWSFRTMGRASSDSEASSSQSSKTSIDAATASRMRIPMPRGDTQGGDSPPMWGTVAALAWGSVARDRTAISRRIPGTWGRNARREVGTS
mmetsp:Transcript_106980/g.301313  ORF Transcript_106980/g.301313 Transcript_106980/m.301313 type:complete len:306 (-) Transcript_106980:1-918(-)